MKNFKEYITEGIYTIPNTLNRVRSIVTADPLNFTWTYTPDEREYSSYEIIARRKIECDNIERAMPEIEKTFNVTVEEIDANDTLQDARYREISISVPWIAWGEVDRNESREQWNNLEHKKLFYIYDLTFRLSESGFFTQLNTPFNMCNFEAYNFYIKQTGTIPEKTIKTLEFLKQYASKYPKVDLWSSEDEVQLSYLKMKYLKSEDLTDDDHALHASLNL